MNRKALLLTTLAASVVLGAAGSSFARMPENMRMGMMRAPREVVFVRLLEQFDTNKHGKITEEEFIAAVNDKFAAVAANQDGTVTPGEVRQYREAQWKAWADKRAKNKANPASDDEDDQDDQAAAPDGYNPDGTATAQQDAGPADQGPDGPMMRDRQRPPHDRMARMDRRHGGMMREVMLFRIVDTDENGQISAAEALAAGNKLFEWIDANGDKVISIDDMPNRPFP